MCNLHLFLLQFELLRLEHFLWHAHGAVLSTEHQVPQLFAKRWCVLVEKAGELDLDLFDLGLLRSEQMSKLDASSYVRAGSARSDCNMSRRQCHLRRPGYL